MKSTKSDVALSVIRTLTSFGDIEVALNVRLWYYSSQL